MPPAGGPPSWVSEILVYPIKIFPDCHLWEGRWVGMMLSPEPVHDRDFPGDGLCSYRPLIYVFFPQYCSLTFLRFCSSKHQLAQQIYLSLLLCLFEAIPIKYESELCPGS